MQVQRENKFGTELGLLLKERKIAVSALARELGLKSKTVIFRILNDECLYTTSVDFLGKLRKCMPPLFSETEFARLENALEITRVGMDAYRISGAFQRLLGRTEEKVEGRIAVEGIDGVEDFDQLMEIYAQARSLYIVLLGIGSPYAMHKFCDLIRRRSEDDTVIDHFFSYNPDRADIVNAVSFVRPVLFSRIYRAWVMNDDDADFSSWIFRSKLMFCHWTDNEGVNHLHQLAATEEHRMLGHETNKIPPLGQFTRMIEEYRENMPLLKRDFGAGVTPADAGILFDDEEQLDAFFKRYIEYTHNNLKLETGCNIYNIKPDIPLALIVPELAEAAFLDGLKLLGIEGGPVLRRGVEQLLHIQEKRFDNVFTNHKVMNNIWSRQKMTEFARTGRTTDHFFIMRSYTPEERVRILSFLMEQNRVNPYFNVYFARSGKLMHDLEVGCYEGVGTLMLRADTSYDLDGDHTEVMIRDAAFSAHFMEYYRTQLLAREVEDAQETTEIFRRLIAIAKASS